LRQDHSSRLSKNACIYQINTRHYTPEGTLRVTEQQIPRGEEDQARRIWSLCVNPNWSTKREYLRGSIPVLKLPLKGECGGFILSASYEAIDHIRGLTCQNRI